MSAGRTFTMIALALLLGLGAAACEKIDRNMWDSPAAGPQSAPIRLPPEGSVPTKGRVHEPTMADAAKLTNPVAGSGADLAKGKELFGIFCVPCHGASGKGDGPVGKKYRPMPANIGPTGHLPHLTDGMIYAVITNGVEGMPAFGTDIPPKDRWLIVAWVRRLGK